ncbi:MAG: poly-beta-1,6-N-acetyl-D-glucosamine biosynthesis protein PgaD [Ectothiorhodospiraceae bacterium]|nr:poly-beta-1,6-N-acetyl-D-glucosamine biosynthesis protein PgaD [Ectothiorhodospiraceae bacterium]
MTAGSGPEGTIRPLVIERPELQSMPRRLGWAAVTALAWMVWVYVWVPVASALAWALELHFVYRHMVVLGGFEAFVGSLRFFAGGVALIACALIGWAKVQEMRFGGRSRRGSRAPVGVEHLARHYRVDDRELAVWRSAQCLAVTHDEHGAIVAVEVLDAPAPAPERGAAARLAVAG